jgi:hypothetical protein
VHRIKSLVCEEVSSVTSGAGIGCQVKFTKRDEENTTMQPSQGSAALVLAKTVIDKANAGQMSQFMVNEAMQSIAKFYFNGSMADMLNSEVGRMFLAPRTGRTTAYEEAELHKREFAKRGADVPRVPNRVNGHGVDDSHDWNESAGLASRSQVGDDPDDESNQSSRPVRTSVSDKPRRARKALTDVELTKIYRAQRD